MFTYLLIVAFDVQYYKQHRLQSSESILYILYPNEERKQVRYISVGFGWLVDDVWACAIVVLSVNVDI